MCLTGVKREPKVKYNTYHYVNVGSMMVGLTETGLTAANVTIMWQSRRSSPSQEIAWYMAFMSAVIAKGASRESRED
jgi:hypothetical protein